MSDRIRVGFTIAQNERSILLEELQKARDASTMPYRTTVIDAAIEAVRRARRIASPAVNVNRPWEAPSNV